MRRKNIQIQTFLLANLVWLSIFLGFFTFFSPVKITNQDLVYCPLQKSWVKREVPKVKFENEIDGICASDKLKNIFSLQVELKTLNFQPQTEKLFFNFVKKGDLAFAEINHNSKLPESNFAQNHQAKKIGNQFQTKINRHELAKFSFQQTARPPNFQKSAKFDFQIIQHLDSISRLIKPRSPPFFA